MASSPALPELRAKRTHARRSCDVCKIRKTRCELPDLEVPSSQEPLPPDKACHRCKILSLPCVVDDSARKQRKRITIAEYGQPSRPKKPRASGSTLPGTATSTPSKSAQGLVDHTLDIFHGLNPADTSAWSLADALGDGTAGGAAAAGGPMPPYGSREPAESWQSKSLKLHGRPLELVCAMLSVAYGKRGLKRAGVEEGYEVDLEGLADADMRLRLEPGVARLRTFHPYLETLPFLFSNHAADGTTSSALLLSLVIYLATLALPNDDELFNIRATLTPYIVFLRDSMLLALPQSFIAIQALNLLCVHAPLGVLPVQMINPRSLAVARGQVFAASQIGAGLKFSSMVRHMTQVSRLHGGSDHMRWEMADNWLYLSTCVAEAALALEEEVVKRPESLPEARELIEDFWASNNVAGIWSTGLHVLSPPELVGRLALCDRIARLSEIIDSCLRIRTNLDTAACEPAFDIVRAIGEELKYLTERLDAIDTKHDSIMALLTPTSDGVEAGWLAYRGLRRRYEANKCYVHGLRAYMATAYLPGHPLAFSGLPTEMQPVQRVSYALSRATNPPDIIPFIMAPNNPATQATWTWGKHRGEICESTVAAFAEVGTGLMHGNPRILLPLHDAMCIAVESSKVLMEMQAGSIMVTRRSKELVSPFRIPGWVYALHQTCDAMRAVAVLSGEQKDKGRDDTGQCNESVASGCANLVGSMVRVVNEWTREIQKEDMEAAGGSTAADATSGTATGISEKDRQDLAAMGLEAHPQHHQPDGMDDAPPSAGVTGEGFGELGHAGQGHYMDSSDRWMASDHRGPSGSRAAAGPAGQNGSYAASGGSGNGSGPDANGPAPTPLDLLLSQMFNYSYQPASSVGQGHPQGQQHGQEGSRPGQAPHGLQDHQHPHQHHSTQHGHGHALTHGQQHPHGHEQAPHLDGSHAHGHGHGHGEASWPPQQQSAAGVMSQQY